MPSLSKALRRSLSASVLLLAIACNQPGGTSNPTAAATESASTPAATAMPIAMPTSTPEVVVPAQPPAEGWVAFTKEGEVWIIHPDGSGLTQLTNNSPLEGAESVADDLRLNWSPDGRYLAASTGGHIFLFDATTLEGKRLHVSTLGGFDWMPGGREILYDTPLKSEPDNNEDHGLWVVDVESGESRQVIPTATGYLRFISPKVSFDGSNVVYSIPPPHPAGYGLVNLESSSFSQLPVSAGTGTGNGDCAWPLVGLTLACHTHSIVTADAPPVLRLIDTNGAIKQEIELPAKLSENFSTVLWSPDGQKIALRALAGSLAAGDLQDETDILTIATQEFQIIAGGAISDWSPDSEWIVTHALTRAPGAPLGPMRLVHLASGETVELVPGLHPIWQPAAVGGAETLADDKRFCTLGNMTLVDRPKGNYLQMCADGKRAEMGPLEDGGFAVGPNGEFFVYCGNSGACYAAKFGATRLTGLGSVKSLPVIARHETPTFVFVFHGEGPYSVEVRDAHTSDYVGLRIPSDISERE